MTAKTTVLFLTHRWDAFVRPKYQRLLDEIGDAADLALLLQASTEALQELALHPPANRSVNLFRRHGLQRSLGYPYLFENSVVPGSTHFPVLAWCRKCRAPGSILVIEFDVEFSGHWRDLVRDVASERADFAALHFRGFDDDPEWFWWASCRPAAADLDWAGDRRNLKRSFNPLYCISIEAIELVDAAHRRGWRGHYEVLLATLLARSGRRIVDLAQLGLCAGREQDARRGLTEDELSTMRWRPEVTRAEFHRRSTGRTLFHPVKDGWLFNGRCVVTLAPAGQSK